MTVLDRMIAAQPAALRAVAARDLGDALTRLGRRRRFALIGTGTSYHAALLGAWALNLDGEVRARAVEAARFVAGDGLRDDEAAILITHTGETAYALRARRALLSADAPIVSITGPAVDWPEAISTPVKEQAETYTVSYTAALAMLCRLVAGLGGEANERAARALDAVADRVEEILGDPGIEHVPMPARALALVGAGPWAVTAREAALKLREGARMLCEGFDAERLLHGFAVPYGPADGLVLLQSDADPDGLVGALGDAARDERIPVCEVAEAAPPDIARATGVEQVLAQIPLTVRLQCLTARMAALRGTDPDHAITGAWAEPGLWEIGAPG